MFTYKFSARNSFRALGSVVSAVLVVVAAHAESSAHPCAPPPPEKLERLRIYVARLNYIEEPGRIRITSSTPANDECFWRVDLGGIGTQPNTIMFLSPDFKYVTPTLLDLQRDPLDEERKRQKSIAAALLAGKPPLTGGSSKAPVIVEFSDFQCPFCKRETDILEKEVLQETHDSVRLEYRYFPLSTHAWAMEAAEVAACAQSERPESFWVVHDFLFQHQSTLAAGHVYSEVRTFLSSTTTSLDLYKLDSCVSNHDQAGTVKTDQALGRSLGIQATPTLFIDGIMLKGLRTADQVREAIRKAQLVANRPAEVGPQLQCKPPVAVQSRGTAQRCDLAGTHE